MPELPEVEVVRAGLDSLVRGATITGVQIYRDSCVRLTPGGPGEFADAVDGRSIAAVVRRGKFLWMLLDGDASEVALSAHLGMSGQFRVHAGDAPPAHRHCRARFTLTYPGEPQRALTLDFLDQRTFGYLHVEPVTATADAAPGGQGSPATVVPHSVTHIARDVLDEHLDRDHTIAALRTGKRAIKQVLLDQTVVSGIGNIYADEALWSAQVSPTLAAHALSHSSAQDVLDAAYMVMTHALVQGGTSFDALYVNVNGESGYFSRTLQAYGRTGKPCARCGSAIERIVLGGRSTHRCPNCQADPPPLAAPPLDAPPLDAPNLSDVRHAGELGDLRL